MRLRRTKPLSLGHGRQDENALRLRLLRIRASALGLDQIAKGPIPVCIRGTVPHFVPHLSQKPSHLVAVGRVCKSSLMARRIYTIAVHYTKSQLSLDGLLINGLQESTQPSTALVDSISPLSL